MDKTGEEDRAGSGWTTLKNGVGQTDTQDHGTGLIGVETSCRGGIGHQRAQAHVMKRNCSFYRHRKD